MSKMVLLAATLLWGGRRPRRRCRARESDYRAADGTILKGYLAADAKPWPAAARACWCHEWWGHNSYARKRADMLAGSATRPWRSTCTARPASRPSRGCRQVRRNGAQKSAADAGALLAALELLRKQPASIRSGSRQSLLFRRQRGAGDGAARHRPQGSRASTAVWGAAVRLSRGGSRRGSWCSTGPPDSFVTAEQIDSFKKEMTPGGCGLQVCQLSGCPAQFHQPGCGQVRAAVQHGRSAQRRGGPGVPWRVAEVPCGDFQIGAPTVFFCDA